MAIVSAIGVAGTITSRRRLVSLSPLLAVLLAAITLTALQLLPLPASVLGMLNDTGTTLRDEGATLAGVDPYRALSMDAPGTRQGLCVLVAMAAIAVVALRIATSERGRYKLVAAVGLVCGVAALVALAHKMVGATSLYGLVDADHHPGLLGPLLNLNHLGGLFAIGTVVAIGLVAYPQQPSWVRAAWLGIAAACGAGTVYTVSRGATIAMAIGALVVLGVLVAQRIPRAEARGRTNMLTSSLPIAIVALCVVVVVIYSGAGSVTRQLENTSLQELDEPRSKFAAWRSAVHVVGEAPLLGVGRGALEPYFTRHHPSSGQVVFSHVENEYLQVATDWGLLGAVVIGAGLVWFTILALRRWREGPLVAAAMGGLAVLATQSLVDFGAEVLGIAAPAIALAAVLSYVPLREAAGRERLRAKITRGVHVAGLVLAAIVLVTPFTTTIVEDHDRISSLASSNLADVSAEIRSSIERHPLDYYGYAVAAELAFRRNGPDGARLLNHALRLNPTHGGLHRIAARRLVKSGHLKQAASSYATAIRFSDNPTRIIEEVANDVPLEIAALSIPTSMPRPDLVASTLLQSRRPALANAWLARVVTRHPDDAPACELLIRRGREAADVEAARIASLSCRGVVTDAGARMQLAQTLVRAEDHPGAIRVMQDIAQATGSIAEKHLAWKYLCDVHRHRGDLVAARGCLDDLRKSPALPEAQRAEVAALQALVDADLATKAKPGPAAP